MTEKAKDTCTCQFVVELKNFKPRIWRRLQINASLPLADLGYAIIVAFRAQASHLFNFYNTTREIYYECARAELIDFFGPTPYQSLDARDFTLAEIFPEVGTKLGFEYDFGDSWEFNVRLEKIINGPTDLKILDGAGYGIIEDCGGIWGLDHIIKLRKKQRGEEYESTAAWMDMIGLDINKFDINEFDRGAMNKNLRKQVESVKHAYEDTTSAC